MSAYPSQTENVLLADDFESSGEDDVPLSAAGARSAPKTPAAPLAKKTSHVKDLQDPCNDAANNEEDFSEGDVDPEAREQALAEQSESDDELLASMEARGNTDALGAYLAAEASVLAMTLQRDVAHTHLSSQSGRNLGKKSNQVCEKKVSRRRASQSRCMSHDSYFPRLD